MVVEVRTKKWGNSIGVIIPRKIVEELNIKPEEKLRLDISKHSNALEELFGSMKSEKTAKELLADVREDLESKWFK